MIENFLNDRNLTIEVRQYYDNNGDNFNAGIAKEFYLRF